MGVIGSFWLVTTREFYLQWNLVYLHLLPWVLNMKMYPTSSFWNTLTFWIRSLINISAHATPVNLSVVVWIGRHADRTTSASEFWVFCEGRYLNFNQIALKWRYLPSHLTTDLSMHLSCKNFLMTVTFYKLSEQPCCKAKLQQIRLFIHEKLNWNFRMCLSHLHLQLNPW